MMATSSQISDADYEARMRAWAKQEAAKLPPFTPEEIRELGQFAARLDAERAEKARQAQTAAAA